MKKFTRILLLALVAIMTIGLLTACETTQEKIENLSSTWTMVITETEDEARAVLEAMELYDEEIALVDLTSMKYVKLVEFRTDKTYRFSYDVETTKEYTREFYETMFSDMYEGRTTLNAIYETEFDAMTKDDFMAFYADLYGAEDAEGLIDLFVENCYNYEELGKDWETGTYTIKLGQIVCTITGETEGELLGYSIEGDSLKLVYADAEEVYTRVN